MHTAAIKISLRVLALFILTLLVYSTYDIAIENNHRDYWVEEGILIFSSPPPYELAMLVSAFLTALFALLAYGLIKLNKTSIGWRQLNIETYMCLFIGLLHNLLWGYQWSIFYPSF